MSQQNQLASFVVPKRDPSPRARSAKKSEKGSHSSFGFIISCGTVTLDRKKRKVLAVYNKNHRIYQLPKGRKNIDEDGLLIAAIRETKEETGYDVQPLKLRVLTR
jgi:8-oxo-dGTP pyrophosphatase MutT (NUDIX family)